VPVLVEKIELILLTKISRYALRAGITKDNPKAKRMMAAIFRKISASNAVRLTRKEIVSVKIVKLVTMPRTAPTGLLLLPPVAVERTIGKSGQIQGARIAARPEMKAIRTTISI